MIVESTRVITATMILFIIPGMIPSELKKKRMVSNENGMKGSTPLGYERTVSGVVNAIEAINQMGISTHIQMAMANR